MSPKQDAAYEAALLELARCYARAAVERYIAEQEKQKIKPRIAHKIQVLRRIS